MLLIHGFAADIATNWGLPGTRKALAKEYRVIAIDNRGHGKSAKPHDPAKYGITYSSKRVVAGAALQSDGRIVRLNFDNALSNDAQYTIHHSADSVVPKIEDRNSALLYGAVLKGDNTPVAGAELTLSTVSGVQRQTADAAGRFLFEYVPRDPDNGLGGGYGIEAHGAGQTASVTGSVRLLHTVHRVNIVYPD